MKSIRYILILTIVFSCQLFQKSLAQTSDKRTDFQTWTDMTLTYFKTQKFSFGGDLGLRGIVSHRNWNLIYIRPTVNYTFTPFFKLSGGIGSFNSINKSISNSYEVRFFQDFKFNWPDLGWIRFQHRFRFEERFFIYENIENTFSMRGRYLVTMKTNNFKFIGPRKEYYLAGMWEAFVPFGNSAPELFVNNQRWYAVMGYRASDTWRFELHYIWQKSRLFSDEGYRSVENVLRFRIFHTLKLPDDISKN